MKILIVGGTGLSGATTACLLRERGHDVSLMARAAPTNPSLADFPYIAGNYMDDDFDTTALSGFDGLVFAAGADIRMLPEDTAPADFFQRANTEAIPKFFSAAKGAGVQRAVYLGTYYPQVAPQKIETDPYVRSRHEADKAIRAMSDDNFAVCSINAPFILGTFPGVVDAHLAALVQYAAGEIQGLSLVAPAGGVMHMTADSVAEALAGALERGAPGRAYLVGDEYFTWKDYFEAFCSAVGKPVTLEVSTGEHPMLPDMILYAGRNAVVKYTPDNAPLNYATGLVSQAIVDIARVYR